MRVPTPRLPPSPATDPQHRRRQPAVPKHLPDSLWMVRSRWYIPPVVRPPRTVHGISEAGCPGSSGPRHPTPSLGVGTTVAVSRPSGRPADPDTLARSLLRMLPFVPACLMGRYLVSSACLLCPPLATPPPSTQCWPCSGLPCIYDLRRPLGAIRHHSRTLFWVSDECPCLPAGPHIAIPIGIVA